MKKGWNYDITMSRPGSRVKVHSCMPVSVFSYMKECISAGNPGTGNLDIAKLLQDLFCQLDFPSCDITDIYFLTAPYQFRFVDSPD